MHIHHSDTFWNISLQFLVLCGMCPAPSSATGLVIVTDISKGSKVIMTK